MTIRELRNRIAVAESTIRPANSMGARLKKLSPTDRSAFDEWKVLHDKWWARATRFRDPGDVYRLMIDGIIEAPELPLSVRRILFAEVPDLPANISDDDAAEAYRPMIEKR